MHRQPRIEYLSVGEELLLGIRGNDHLTFLGEQLARHGQVIQRNLVITDNPSQIEHNFRDSWESADIVITTGGLGPTTDDVTREAIAKTLGLKLVHVPELEQKLRERFKRRGRAFTENILKQAYLIEGAEAIPNAFGTAPGQWLRKDGKILIMLPGPGNEMRPMFKNEVLPRLKTEGIVLEHQAYLQLRTFGAGESQLETILQSVINPYGDRLNIAFCAHYGGVDVRLCPAGDNLEWPEIQKIADQCRDLLGEDFVCFGDCTTARLLIDQLRALGKTLAVAESCTGGELSNILTDIPGASKVFVGGLIAYTNSVKVDLLKVPEDILQQHGAVSAECAVAMAIEVAERLEADYALSVTGFAGPDGGTREDPTGTIYLGYFSPDGTWSRRVVYPGNRRDIKKMAAQAALDLMRRQLKKYEVVDLLPNITS